MHSHDRTMLARMGFDDPDKRNPIHDLACQYLSQQDVADNVINEVNRIGYGMSAESRAGKIKVMNEEPLTKGSGQYEVIVGFLDVVYEVGDRDGFMTRYIVEVKTSKVPTSEIIRQMKFYRDSIKNCDKFYETKSVRERDLRMNFTRWVTKRESKFLIEWIVLLDFDITDEEEQMIVDCSGDGGEFYVVYLGENFDRFLAERGRTR